MKRLIPVIAATCLAVAITAQAATPTTTTGKLSYAMGYKTGQAMKMRHVTINTNTFATGLRDGYTGKKPLLSQKQIQVVLTNMQKQMMQKMKHKFATLATKNAIAGKRFLAANAKKPGITTLPSGLQYKVIKKGSGMSPTLTNSVKVNYKGMLLNGKVFDSSYKRGKPITFKVGGVIKGWQQALTHMKPGATWMLYIPSNLAYGERGSFGGIGPNETLIFKVNLMSVKK